VNGFFEAVPVVSRGGSAAGLDGTIGSLQLTRIDGRSIPGSRRSARLPAFDQIDGRESKTLMNSLLG
jgi:hypothetical protein